MKKNLYQYMFTNSLLLRYTLKYLLMENKKAIYYYLISFSFNFLITTNVQRVSKLKISNTE